MSGAYYNELDPNAAQWIRNLIARGVIAPGEVDTRSIVEVRYDDIKHFTQCHFFAGIGVWSYALRAAGWDDDRPVWTGSCPCQPFSAAGKQEGTADPRHLWPVWFELIRVHRPVAIFGEQVAAAIRHAWLDLVQSDLEGLDYAVGSAVLGAHSVGAPHIRQRLFFVGHAVGAGRQSIAHVAGSKSKRVESGRCQPLEYGEAGGGSCELAHSDSPRRRQGRSGEAGDGRGQAWVESSGLRAAGDMGNPHQQGSQGRRECAGAGADQCAAGTPSAVNGFWSNVEWLPCTDGKARPVEPGTFPLAHGAPARVRRLRAYGNAINAEVARHFIAAYMETRGEQ